MRHDILAASLTPFCSPVTAHVECETSCKGFPGVSAGIFLEMHHSTKQQSTEACHCGFLYQMPLYPDMHADQPKALPSLTIYAVYIKKQPKSAQEILCNVMEHGVFPGCFTQLACAISSNTDWLVLL